MNECKVDNNNENLPEVAVTDTYDFLNLPISDEEILEAVKKLKNNKSPGHDLVINEHIFTTVTIFLPVYRKLFNLIYDRGYVPDEWLIGIIKPIFKNKGDPTQPENYRPITLLSCLGKLFTCILSKRLDTYASEINLITSSQAGFRKNHSTLDHILTLQFLSNTLLCRKKKLFCAFVDFKQAFDTVWRNGLWYKLLDNGIGGKCYAFIRNMYKGIKSKICMNGMSSDFFCCNIGVRQGENLSPFLFSLYINDLEDFLLDKNIVGLQSISSSIEDELMLYLKLCLLFYADDTVIMSETADDLQKALDEFHVYCSQWKLNVNVEKTKILVFSKGPKPKNIFYYNNNVVEIVSEFKYLGTVFSRSGSFCKAKKHLVEQAQKAMYSIIRKIRLFNLPMEQQFDLFDKVVVPVLLYACEIWGYENIDIIEKIHLKFLKYILCMKSSTPSYMVYGESGRYPLYVTVYSRMISYWTKMIQGQDNKIVFTVYKYLANQYMYNNDCVNPWTDFIRHILDSCGFSNIWTEQCTAIVNDKWISAAIKQRLQDQFIQKWAKDIDNSSKGQIYKIYKQKFGFEKYLGILTKKFWKPLIKFRTANHRLPIETGRWYGIPVNDRSCTLCNSGKLADEYHFILECKFFLTLRKQFLCTKYFQKPSTLKFRELLMTTNIKTLKKLSSFILNIQEQFCCPA